MLQLGETCPHRDETGYATDAGTFAQAYRNVKFFDTKDAFRKTKQQEGQDMLAGTC